MIETAIVVKGVLTGVVMNSNVSASSDPNKKRSKITNNYFNAIK